MPLIPNIRAARTGEDWRLDGVPRHSLIAISSRACLKIPENRRLLVENVKRACDELEPAGIIWHGSEILGVSDYPRSLGIPLHVFPGEGLGAQGEHR